LQNISYFVALLSDRLDRLEKVVVGDDIEAIREMIFLERAAFHSLQHFLDDESSSFPNEEIEPLLNRLTQVADLTERKMSEMESKLKQIQRSNEKIRKFAATEKTEMFVSKSV
jgi:hypothetical protein